MTSPGLPPYSYVPGKFPHPLRDPAGHNYGHAAPSVVLSNPNAWRTCPEFRRGVDLFNHGYYWESHESWEAVWNALGRRGREADFVKGLIKLAAAGVKAREGRTEGVARHARRAKELFHVVASGSEEEFGGLSLTELLRAANDLVREPQAVVNDSAEAVVVVFPFTLSCAPERSR